MACNTSVTKLSEEELTKLAVQKILEETKIASNRVDCLGVLGWQSQKKSVNKKFLNNTLLANAQFNNRKDKYLTNDE